MARSAWRRRVRRAARALRRVRLPRLAWALLAAALLAATAVAVQLARKPTELVALVAPDAPKRPEGTWSRYGPFFEAHATEVVTPELLAALAQVESSGDPLALPPWRWRWTLNPLSAWAPASSAVGLLQMTDGNFALARRLCIHGHTVAEAGPWHDLDACWFNALYLRTVPSHAIEMTSAWLHRSVEEILARERPRGVTLARKRRLAAVVHLCGRERGAAFVRRGFRVVPAERCGEHHVERYLARVEELTEAFARIAGRTGQRGSRAPEPYPVSSAYPSPARAPSAPTRRTGPSQ